ncbi:MAG: single-stranded-DNA-specific exonuclease RecJ [Dokdonella sp.]|uniref:single-stranded-DNA-specific exonuclease RecJ n=1 Tax=Dokdonella sp. TaxID=2291710 RepID=UPI0025BCC136|nr:single-stranded-DNA-specific exonuclease RecJ [Dokdonella sp.]MBZ0222136.1 single-stranded-DNA-specific exonuclease RecJ [Dokdonella sp.]MCC7254737.1 single-stranded-DNA-specific exonuclease RecJ [Dokdonella sp.]
MKVAAIRRRADVDASHWPADVHPLLARIYALRGLQPKDLERARLADLLPPSLLGGTQQACELLIAALRSDARICVVGDFDADGATGAALALRGLRLLGAHNLGYRVPNRAREGYGLSRTLVESLAAADRPALILTVDNGIASLDGVAAAKALGIEVIITDHHLPGPQLPLAGAIVNPLLDEARGEGRPSPLRHLAGVGVMFYLLLALRARLFPRGTPQSDRSSQARPDLSQLLDLVALGTVADLVPLDANNRILVAAGLRQIRAGRSCAGISALLRAAKRDASRVVAADLGFALGPRVNAAGRLEDMSLGIECLLSDDAQRAFTLATELSQINTQRQGLQVAMVGQAEEMVMKFLARHGEDSLPSGIVLHEPDWHPGVVGLVASRLKERLHRPVIACAPAEPGSSELRGSARSIAGFHLRDALAEVDVRCPGLITRFGGHAMAAGLSLPIERLGQLAVEFDAVARERLDAQALEHFVWSDGEPSADEFTLPAARALRDGGPWGQGFAEPVFDAVFTVDAWRAVGERHLKMSLRAGRGADLFDAILFDAAECMPPPPQVRALFQLDVNEWNGRESLQLLLRQIEAI